MPNIERINELLARAEQLQNSSPNFLDYNNAFRQAMIDAGLVCTDPPIADGKINRFHVEGDRPGSKNGWYVFHGDGIPAGSFGSWKNGETHTWCAKRTETMTKAERAEYRKRIERAKAERERAKKEGQAEAKTRAEKIWKNAKPAPADHPYLVKKGIKPYGIRVHDGALVIPMRDASTVIHSLQFIDAEGNKRFLPDGAVQSHYKALGKLTEPLYLCEGYSTGASIHEATGCGVIVAFNAGNLLPVAKAISGKYPDQTLVIAGDNDQWTGGNPGVTKATEAAKAINAEVAIPTFKDTASKPSDFNDQHQVEGLDMVRKQLERAQKITTSSSETCSMLDDEPEITSKLDDEVIAELAKLPPIEYDRRRESEAKRFGIRITTLDDEVKRARTTGAKSNGQGQSFQFEDPDPWPEPVDGAALLDMILAMLKRFIAFSNEDQAIATTLWVMLSHCYDAADTLPRLAPISPTKRCGKTTLLKLLRRMVRRPMITSNTTPAAIFRRIEHDHPTLLVDELDSFADSHDELRGILNSGHDRESAYVDRTVGDNHEPKLFSTWAPMALAKIKDLPDTLQDRSIVIRLQRRKRGDKLTKTTGRNLNKHCPLNGEIPSRCARWADDNMERLKGHEPTIPPGLIDRDEDNWLTMLAIAELVGGHWPERARAAAIELSETDELDQGIDGLLFADIRQVFHQTDQLKSSDLVEALRLLEGRPWRDWGKDRNNPGLTERDLSKRLKPYGIRPDRLHFDGNSEKGMRQRGYRLEWFERAFDTYIRDDQDDDTDSEPSQIPLPPGPPADYPSTCPSTEKTSAKPLSVPVPDSEVGTDENHSKPLENKAWDTWTDKKGGTGGRERKKCPTCDGHLYWRPRDGEDRHWRCRKCVPSGRMRIELWDAETDERVSLGGDE